MPTPEQVDAYLDDLALDRAVLDALHRSQGNRRVAARLMGLSLRNYLRRLEALRRAGYVIPPRRPMKPSQGKPS